MSRNKKALLAVAALACVMAALLAVYLGARPDTSAGAKHIHVEVVHGDGSAKEFAYDTDAEYLGEALLAQGLIEGEEGQFGLYIHTVDGERAVYEEDGAYWALYQGEEYASQGIDLTPIRDGDSFSLVYTRD